MTATASSPLRKARLAAALSALTAVAVPSAAPFAAADAEIAARGARPRRLVLDPDLPLRPGRRNDHKRKQMKGRRGRRGEGEDARGKLPRRMGGRVHKRKRTDRGGDERGKRRHLGGEDDERGGERRRRGEDGRAKGGRKGGEERGDPLEDAEAIVSVEAPYDRPLFDRYRLPGLEAGLEARLDSLGESRRVRLLEHLQHGGRAKKPSEVPPSRRQRGLQGSGECACSPLSFRVTLDLSRNCDDDTLASSSGILDTDCTIEVGDPERQVTNPSLDVHELLDAALELPTMPEAVAEQLQEPKEGKKRKPHLIEEVMADIPWLGQLHQHEVLLEVDKEEEGETNATATEEAPEKVKKRKNRKKNNPGARRLLSHAGRTHRRLQSSDEATPVSITSITFVEIDAAGDIVKVDDRFTDGGDDATDPGNIFVTGSAFDLTSANADLDPNQPLGGQDVADTAVLFLIGANEAGEEVRGRFVWRYDNSCNGDGGDAVVGEGDVLAWAGFGQVKSAGEDLCPRSDGPRPTALPTPQGTTAEPTKAPSATPTTEFVDIPTFSPTINPTLIGEPTGQDTEVPTFTPTDVPSPEVTPFPTKQPDEPTPELTPFPTVGDAPVPTPAPTRRPTPRPVDRPEPDASMSYGYGFASPSGHSRPSGSSASVDHFLDHFESQSRDGRSRSGDKSSSSSWSGSSHSRSHSWSGSASGGRSSKSHKSGKKGKSSKSYKSGKRWGGGSSSSSGGGKKYGGYGGGKKGGKGGGGHRAPWWGHSRSSPSSPSTSSKETSKEWHKPRSGDSSASKEWHFISRSADEPSPSASWTKPSSPSSSRESPSSPSSPSSSSWSGSGSKSGKGGKSSKGGKGGGWWGGGWSGGSKSGKKRR